MRDYFELSVTSLTINIQSHSGCTFVCVCGVVWGNGPPCIMIKHPDTNAAKSLHEYEVYKKKHSLVNIDIDYRLKNLALFYLLAVCHFGLITFLSLQQGNGRIEK